MVMSLVDNNKQWWQRSRAAVAVELVAPFDLKIHENMSGRTELEILGCPEMWMRADSLEAIEQFGIAVVNAVHAERVRQRNDAAAALDFGPAA
jgi:hypothetical protein